MQLVTILLDLLQ